MSRIVGIDLGTSTSELACIVDGVPKLIPNTAGKLITPSVVHIREDGTHLVGEEAAEYLFTRPECTFMEVKRLTGGGEILRAHGKEYSPEDLQAILLRYLVNCAETYLEEKIDRAVITVPAYFTDVQRRATTRAGELAGLTVERIINEPTAAALDYGLANLKECKNVLVYDLGGGTLDVTVLELFEGVLDVKASRGNNRLGGKDFDEIIMRHLADPAGDERAVMRLKRAAEDCKIALSAQDFYRVSLPFLTTAKDGKPVSLEKTVTRADFERWVEETVASTREPMMAALSDSGLSTGDLDIVLLVGGSTRIPCVRKLVEDSLSASAHSLLDPDLTVARGAAIQAGLLDGSVTASDLVLTDVCPYTLGIEVLHESSFDVRLLADPIIPRNTTIPTEKSKIYYPVDDFQTTVRIKAYQGDSSDPENNEFLGEVRLTGIPPARRGKREPIEVTFAYDVNGILQVKAAVVSTGQKVSAEISTTGVKPKPSIDVTQWEKAEGAKRFRPAIRKAEKLIAAGEDEDGDLAILVRQIKEALLLDEEDQAEYLREELRMLLESMK
ncbi:MAG: Hsp70 family protein [Spirochaetaceae bacterium]|jgi:molecular chaperone DnaK|nr:Hsp70 family protein [Spirochaetaceae bacterium]